MMYEAGNKQNIFSQKNIDFKLIISLAIATSIDALVVGMSIAFLSVPILLSITVIGVVTFFLSLIGIYLGSKFRGLFQNKAGILGGFILIFIGLKILFDHLFF